MSASAKPLFLENMRNFITSEYLWLRNSLDDLGWNIQDLEQSLINDGLEFVPCPVRAEHRIPINYLEVHTTCCAKKYEHYPEVVENQLTDTASSELPGNESNILLNLNINPNQDTEVAEKSSGQSSSKCLMELLSAERDAKRRRAAHRGKRVHSNKKSYNEILKEVIDNEMKMLGECNSKTEVEQSQQVRPTTADSISKEKFMYEGVGSLHYRRNPYNRWKSIHKEELEFLKLTETNVECEKESRRRNETTSKSIPDRRHNLHRYKNERECVPFRKRIETYHRDSFSTRYDDKNRSSDQEISRRYEDRKYKQGSCDQKSRICELKQNDGVGECTTTSKCRLSGCNKYFNEIRNDSPHAEKKSIIDDTREYRTKESACETYLVEKNKAGYSKLEEEVKFSAVEQKQHNNPFGRHRKRIYDSCDKSSETSTPEKKRHKKKKKHKKKDRKKKNHRSRHSP